MPRLIDLLSEETPAKWSLRTQRRSLSTSRATTSSTPVSARSSSTSTSTSRSFPRRKCVTEIQIPFVPKYVPLRQRTRDPLQQVARSEPLPSAPTGHIVSRYTSDGEIIFAITTKQSNDLSADGTHEIEVDLANIHEHVTSGELERFEHNVFEEEEKRERAGEEKRERSKPKLGRPRKRTRSSQPTYKGSEKLETAENLKKPKRPFGRPRKQPTGRRTRSNFQGVLIQSPLKRGLEVINTSSSSSSDSSPSSSVPSLRSQDIQIPDSHTTLPKIDQLTPSNARRVVGDKSVRAELSRSKAHLRQTSIVEGAFGDGFSDETGSEDELTAASPNVNRHFAHKVKVAPMHDLDNDHEARHTIVDSQRRDTQPNEETVYTTISPKTPTSGKDIRKSMTPLIPAYTTSTSHFSVQGPKKRIRGGAALQQGSSMMRDPDEILSLLNGERNISVEDHTITLGSLITSSGEEDDPRALQRSISCRPALSTSVAPTSRHRTSHPFEHRKVSRGEPVMTYDERADPSVRSTLPEIVLGRLITRTSDAAEPEHAPPSEARQEPDGLAMKDLQKKRRRSPSVGKEGWYRMVRR